MNKRLIGKEKETIASDFLRTKGYHILQQNFQCRSGEIDIIAKDQEYYVFIEVKYRKNNVLGSPEDAIDIRKIRKISQTARFYLLKNHLSEYTPCRFDVVSILNQEMQLITNAFDAIF